MDYNREYFKGKTAVVTGAASGVGLALTEELLECGAAKVLLADINQEQLEKHVARLREATNGKNMKTAAEARDTGRVKGIVCDVTDEGCVRSMVTRAVGFFGGRLDLLFNNAGFGASGWFDELDNADWKSAFDLNFYGALYGMRAALPIMAAQGGGQIVNIISGIAFTPMACQTRYAAATAALHALSIALRSEYWDYNIQINSATPGATATAIWAGGEVPKTAQTPHQSASRILDGAAKNDRIICGDDGDADGLADCNNYEKRNAIDVYLLNVARERRQGKTGI